MADVVTAQRLTKVYRGAARGVDKVDFDVRQGEVFGFLGPNGAGKTTTIRLLLDLIRPTPGRIERLRPGLAPRQSRVRRRHRLPARRPSALRAAHRARALVYFATLRGLRGFGDGPATRAHRARARPADCASLSKGNRQKVGLVQALHAPSPTCSSSTSPPPGSTRLSSRRSTSSSRETRRRRPHRVPLLPRAARGAARRRPRRAAARRAARSSSNRSRRCAPAPSLEVEATFAAATARRLPSHGVAGRA